MLLIKDKSGSLRQDGKKKVSVFLAPKVVLVQQVSPVTSSVLVPLCPCFESCLGVVAVPCTAAAGQLLALWAVKH